MNKIAIIGAGYVGIGTALVLSSHADIDFFDVNKDVVDQINHHESPIQEPRLALFFQGHKNVHASSELNKALFGATACFICVPTPLDEATGKLDVSIIDAVLKDINDMTDGRMEIIIRSTLNIEDGDAFSKKYPKLHLSIMPEFLREKLIYEDALQPSRVIIGAKDWTASLLAIVELYLSSLKHECPKMLVSMKEATSIKLLSNAYLATRISYFNEVDDLAKHFGLDSGILIQGICFDPRIGDYYNEPSSGFGGKCLPKDLVATLTTMKEVGVEHDLFDTVHAYNEERKHK